MRLRLLAFILTITTLLSCADANRKSFYLSNPTDKEIKVTIDDTAYTLAPQTFEVLQLDRTIHELEYNGQKTKFKVFKLNSGGIINPTLEPHYIYSMVYATQGNFDIFESIENDVAIDGVVYTDNIKSTNALFIDNNLYRCTYFLGEEYPEEQIMHSGNMLGNFYNKFFTKAEFLTFYDDYIPTEYKRYHAQNKEANGKYTITESNTVVLKLPAIDNQQLLNLYKKEMELLVEYKNSNNFSRQLNLQNEIQALSRSRSKLEINYSKYTDEQNQAIDDFDIASYRISNAGILQL